VFTQPDQGVAHSKFVSSINAVIKLKKTNFMETINIHTTKTQPGKIALWTGRIMTILSALFLLVDAIMKIIEAAPAIEGSLQLGWPQDAVQGIGIVLLAATILYSIPRTAIFGAILLTGYLGGAVAIMVRVAQPGHPYFFPIIFGVLVWGGLFLRDEKLRALIPFRKED
jgi:hypothetical protein